MGTRARRYGIGVSAAIVLAMGACGGDRTFTAQEFVDEVKAEGVELVLGEELFTEGENKELYAVELRPAAELPEDEGTDGEDHAGGSISIYDGTSGADEEIENCRASADLLCYQAGNVVVVVEGGGIESQQLGIAIQRLSEK